VLDYLVKQGWKISQPGIYKHRKEGKLRPNAHGAFTLRMVESYAVKHLRRLDGGMKYSEELERHQSERTAAETRKTIAQAEHWEIRTKALSGDFVPRQSVERGYAARAAVLKSDDENWIYATAGELIQVVAGDPSREADLIDFLRSSRESVFARYNDQSDFVAEITGSLDDDIDYTGGGRAPATDDGDSQDD
jgi:hypothetical protein